MRLPHRVTAPLLVGLLAVSPGGCEDDGGEESTCALTLSVSGDFTGSVTEDRGAGCLIQHSFGAGIDVTYLPRGSGEPGRVDLSIDDVTQGETGEGFPATIRVRHSDERVWQANGCVVTIDVHEAHGTSEDGEDYRVAGSGTCPSNATDGAEGSLTVAPFDFVVVVTWRT